MSAAMPGPLSAALRSGSKDAAREIARHLAPSVAKFSDAVAERGKGSYVWTTDGKRHLDMACGIGVISTGHCHPKVVSAIQQQAAQMIMAQQNIFTSSTAQVGLLDRLVEIVPPHLSRFFFANSGSEAVDNAIKIARGATGKQNIIAFENSFHGRTYGAMAATSSKTYYRTGFSPLMPGVFFSPYPYCLQCTARQLAPDGNDWYKLEPNIPPYAPYEARRCCRGPHEALTWLLKQQTAPEDTAAVIIEPIMGEGGFLTPPPDFLQHIRKVCDDNNMLLIMDEVQAGVGRTGKWWGHQHLPGADADIMIFAKGIASGFPFAGIAAREHLFERMAPGTLGGTYGGSVLGCAAASATLDAINEEGMLDNATQRGNQLVAGLLDLAKRYPIIDVRGRGLMVAAEFGGPDGSLKAKSGTAAAITKAASQRGMLLLSAGARETIRFLPPLNVSDKEIAEALDILSASLKDVFDKQ